MTREMEQLRQKILTKLDLTRDTGDEELEGLIYKEVGAYSRTQGLSLTQREQFEKEIYHSLRKLDVLQELVEDPLVTEIMVNGPDHIFFEKDGRVCQWDRQFYSREKLEDVIQQIVAAGNKLVNEANPIVDTRLRDGSRVNIVLSPIAIDGSAITIRKFPEQPMRMEQLIQLGAVSAEVAAFLKQLVQGGYNLFISGGTGAGKTTFLNALSEFIPSGERVITIEDSAELQIQSVANLIRLETRNANMEGVREISIRDLIRTSLRMRPNRIIIGECRGAETLDMLQAMNTGHDGSISTGHANSSQDMLKRLETMVLMGMDLPIPAIRAQIASGINILVHLGRLRDCSRKLLNVDEIDGIKDGEIRTHSIYQFVETTAGQEGKVIGTWEKTGVLQNTEKLKEAGLL
ncbi:MAG: CpaF family protein [Eubacterium sp.]|nr:CpaF family protein [Eubacterium sp.]